jgi:hypothetical protein
MSQPVALGGGAKKTGPASGAQTGPASGGHHKYSSFPGTMSRDDQLLKRRILQFSVSNVFWMYATAQIPVVHTRHRGESRGLLVGRGALIEGTEPIGTN